MAPCLGRLYFIGVNFTTAVVAIILLSVVAFGFYFVAGLSVSCFVGIVARLPCALWGVSTRHTLDADVTHCLPPAPFYHWSFQRSRPQKENTWVDLLKQID